LRRSPELLTWPGTVLEPVPNCHREPPARPHDAPHLSGPRSWNRQWSRGVGAVVGWRRNSRPRRRALIPDCSSPARKWGWVERAQDVCACDVCGSSPSLDPMHVASVIGDQASQAFSDWSLYHILSTQRHTSSLQRVAASRPSRLAQEHRRNYLTCVPPPAWNLQLRPRRTE
jgi:hypothetical protein